MLPAAKIKAFLADREFIGAEWFRFLRDRDVPFCIRVRKDTTVAAGSGTWGPARWLFRDLPAWEAPVAGQKLTALSER